MGKSQLRRFALQGSPHSPGDIRRSAALYARRTILAAAVAAAGLVGGVTAAFADTTVKWLYIETNPEIIQYWKDIIAKFEQSHPGVKVETQFLENEAYKAKLPTL